MYKNKHLLGACVFAIEHTLLRLHYTELVHSFISFHQYLQSLTIQTLHLQPSINPPSFSTIYSTTASGPLLTCSPCGSARVLTSGLISRARDRTASLCSGVHIEAVNCEIDEPELRNKRRKRGERTTTSGRCCSRIEGAASGPRKCYIHVSLLTLLHLHQLMETRPLTLSVRYMLNHIAVLDDFDDTAYESLRTLGCVVDCDERVGSFGSWRGHPASFFLWWF
jgi:hypothetical protein